MAETSPMCQANTFVVRFYREWSPAGRRWRGRVTHLPSGRSANFVTLESLLDFVRSFGVTAEHRDTLRRSDD